MSFEISYVDDAFELIDKPPAAKVVQIPVKYGIYRSLTKEKAKIYTGELNLSPEKKIFATIEDYIAYKRAWQKQEWKEVVLTRKKGRVKKSIP